MRTFTDEYIASVLGSSGAEVTKEGDIWIVDGNLDLSGRSLTAFFDNVHVTGALYLDDNPMRELPKRLKASFLSIIMTGIEIIPADTEFDYCECNPEVTRAPKPEKWEPKKFGHLTLVVSNPEPAH